MKTVSKIIIIAVLAALLIFVLAGGLDRLTGKTFTGNETTASQAQTSTTPGEAVRSGSVYINEVMTKNQTSLTLKSGETPDWIELYNASGSTVSLSGYGLSDDSADPYKYKFKETSIQAGGYLVVLAADSSDTKDEYIRLGFGLSSSGETITLTDPNKETVSRVKTGNMVSDISYGLTDKGKYEYFANPTPGAENSGPTSDVPEFSRKISNAQIILNEYIIKNESSIIDSFGERHPWVEIKNISSKDMDISGYGLTDNGKKLGKWRFPDGTKISAGGFIVVIMSGRDTVINKTEYHASFRLGSDDKNIVLSDANGATLDSVTIAREIGTASSGRTVDNTSVWQFFPSPTPGQENTTKHFSTLKRADDKYLPN